MEILVHLIRCMQNYEMGTHYSLGACIKINPKIWVQIVGNGLLALGYGRLRRLRKEVESENCVEYKLTEIGSKWPKEQKRWSEVRETKSLDGERKEDKSTRNMDHGQLNKWKNPAIDTLEHLTEKKERQAGEALKMQVNLT